jgi:hypothetical protein
MRPASYVLHTAIPQTRIQILTLMTASKKSSGEETATLLPVKEEYTKCGI